VVKESRAVFHGFIIYGVSSHHRLWVSQLEEKLPTATACPSVTLEQALASIRDWGLADSRHPDDVVLLGHGLTNQSYLLRWPDRQLVLRLNASNSQQLGLDREMENTIHRSAAQHNLAPNIFYSDANWQFVVTDYITGGFAVDHYRSQADYLNELGAWLKRLHALPATGRAVTIAERIKLTAYSIYSTEKVSK